MTRYLATLVLPLALGVMPMVGCSDEETASGTGGEGGHGGGTVACVDNVCPCTEAGIRAAIAEGGGRFAFDCEAPQPPNPDPYTEVVTEAEIVIDNDVILDGEGRLRVSGDADHVVFSVPQGVSVTLSNLQVVEAFTDPRMSGAAAIVNEGDLTLTGCTVRDNYVGGISSSLGGGAALTITESDVSANLGTGIVAAVAVMEASSVTFNARGGVLGRELRLVNSTISENSCFGTGWDVTEIWLIGALELINSTVVSEAGIAIYGGPGGGFVRGSIIDGECRAERGAPLPESDGYNIESPGDTCGFDPDGSDQVNVGPDQLKLQGLRRFFDSTDWHGLDPGSVAIDAIPQADCTVDTDQRGVERPQGDACDVGAVEMEVTP